MYEDDGGFIEGGGRDVDIRRFAPAHVKAGTDLDGAVEAGSEDPAPNSALWYFNRGLAYSDKGDTDDAIVDFIRSIILGLEHSEICWSGGLAGGKGQRVTVLPCSNGLTP
jgi:hypothetical protein